MTVLDSELDMQSSVAVVYLLSIVIKKSVVDFFIMPIDVNPPLD